MAHTESCGIFSEKGGCTCGERERFVTTKMPSPFVGRPTQVDMMMGIAHVVSNRSTCRRAAVGCVISNMEMTQVLAIGYNGNARGLPNACDTDVPGACGCIHAEVNALIKAPYDRGALWLFTTTEPCPTCAKLILNTRINTVFFHQRYRDGTGTDLLRHAGIQVVCTGG